MAKRANLSNLPLAAKVIAALAMASLVALAYFFLFFGDIADSIEAARQKEQRLRQDLAQARRLEFEYQKDLTELTERQQRQSELKKVLPSESEYPSFLGAIQSVANVSGVGLVAWSPRPEVVKEFYATVPMQLTLTGRYHQVAKFFYGVGQLPRIINMEDISIKDPNTDGADVAVRATVMATAFRALDSSSEAKKKRPDKRGGR